MPTPSELKQVALLRDFCQAQGVKLGHNKGLELVAKLEGFRDLHHRQAVTPAPQPNEPTSADEREFRFNRTLKKIRQQDHTLEEIQKLNTKIGLEPDPEKRRELKKERTKLNIKARTAGLPKKHEATLHYLDVKLQGIKLQEDEWEVFNHLFNLEYRTIPPVEPDAKFHEKDQLESLVYLAAFRAAKVLPLGTAIQILDRLRDNPANPITQIGHLTPWLQQVAHWVSEKHYRLAEAFDKAFEVTFEYPNIHNEDTEKIEAFIHAYWTYLRLGLPTLENVITAGNYAGFSVLDGTVLEEWVKHAPDRTFNSYFEA